MSQTHVNRLFPGPGSYPGLVRPLFPGPGSYPGLVRPLFPGPGSYPGLVRPLFPGPYPGLSQTPVPRPRPLSRVKSVSSPQPKAQAPAPNCLRTPGRGKEVAPVTDESDPPPARGRRDAGRWSQAPLPARPLARSPFTPPEPGPGAARPPF
ncbi:tetra-peptide repeat homeobox protein 1-like [Chiloscyllium plagiosum]|uniref:tetra-peptide repeat homeobox protein 1-like n=1 Tax=Chiloscyllium plagiosum TaxID=36176 RepID=UPI001CB7D7E9|nr:tetra-peptide repeat homeobox protein 1-like [Chiloscyllium plagiosum]